MLLIGENAQGKTNFLEALYILSYGSSFRAHRSNDVITLQQHECGLNASLLDDNNVTHHIHFQHANDERRITVNGNTVADRKQLLYHNPTIVFSYDDYRLITEGHELRRMFFDQVQCFISIQYVDLIRNYKRILRQRNKALKERNTSALDVYNYQLATHGVGIMEQRRQCIRRCSQHASELFHNMLSTNDTIEFSYSPSWAAESVESVVRHLEQKLNNDLRIGHSTSGPHRDKIQCYINGKDAVLYASTGQVRSVALVAKIVQSMIIFEILDKKPVLLFDDVLLELDAKREQGVLGQLPDTSQLFFTFLPHKESDLFYLDDIQKIVVKDGALLSG